MTTVTLHGPLAQWGETFQLAARSPREAVCILVANFPDLGTFLQQSEQAGIRYAVLLDGEEIGPDELHAQADEAIDLVPVPIASSGVTRFVTGAALIGASFFVPAGGLLGVSYLGAGQIATFGASLLLGGLSQIISGDRNSEQDEVALAENFTISGRLNTDRSGRAMPIQLGTRFVEGLVLISATLTTVDIEVGASQ